MDEAETLEPEALLAQTTSVPPISPPPAEAQSTTTAVVDLLAVLHATLALLDSRATTLAAILLASFIAVWSDLHTFASGAPAILAWLSWATLIVALLAIARVMLPHRIVRFGHALFGTEDRPYRFDSNEHVEVLVTASWGLKEEITWLRRHVMLSVALAIVALLEVVVAYIIEKA